MGAGVVINTSVIQLDKSGFRSSEDGEGSTGSPSLTTIVAVKGTTVALGEILAILPLVQISTVSVIVHRSHEDLRWHQEAALVFTLAQGDTRVTTIGRSLPPVLIRPDYDLFRVPSFTVVAASVEDLCGLEAAGEDHDVARVLIDSHIRKFTPSDMLALIAPIV